MGFAMSTCLRHTAGVATLVAVLGAMGTARAWAFHHDTEEELVPRIQSEHNPIKKAKYEIRLAHLKLLHGAGACQEDDHEACKRNLNSYLDLMRNSWKDLKASGHAAVKQPSGFKELDIALREDARTLDDSKLKIPYEDQGGIDAVIQQVNLIHHKVFSALFPDDPSNSPASKSVPPGGNHPPEASHPAGGGNQ